MGKVQVEWFALLRECAGRSHEEIDLEGDDATPAKLWSRLAEKYNFPLKSRDVRVAINDRFADFDAKITGGDKIVFIPPVSGG
jgi:molybdopterin converting factor subunit 1